MFPQIWNVLCKKKLGKTSINLYSSDFYEKNGYTEIIYFLTYEFYLHDLMNLKIFPWKINFSQSVFSPTPVFHMEKCFFSPEVFFLTLFQESLKSRQVSGHKHTREKMTSSDSRRRNFFTWPLGASTDTEHSQTSFITYFLYLHVFQTVVEHFECWLLTKRNMNIS